MALRDKYAFAVQTAKDVKMQGTSDEHDGKLFFKGTVDTQDQANQIWNAIKTIPDWRNEIVADIKATRAQTASTATAPAAAPATTYTVKPGDTLSKIAQSFLGDSAAYMDIFAANKDQLSDPDKIKPGQTLKIPQNVKR